MHKRQSTHDPVPTKHYLAPPAPGETGPNWDKYIESTIRRTTLRVGVYLCLFIALLVVLSILQSCSAPQTHADATPTAAERAQQITAASVVTLMRPVPEERALALCWAANECAPQYTPAGNAFAISYGGRVRLMTAAHCVRENTRDGATVLYLAPSGWGYDRAHLVWANRGTDIAELAPSPGSEPLVPLRWGRVPDRGETVLGLSSLYHEHVTGPMLGDVTVGWLAAALDIRLGWSGSPVLGPDGGVFGLVSKCDAGSGEDCRPGKAYLAQVVP